MQFSIRRLLLLTAIVAWMFGQVGRYWPLGTAIAVVVCASSGGVLLAFGNVKSWKLVVWAVAVSLGSLLGVRYALGLQREFTPLEEWPQRTVDACVLLAGAVLSGGVAALALAMLSRKSLAKPSTDVSHDEPDRNP